MLYAEFAEIGAASAHRASHGGWLFLADCGRVFWFSLSLTASRVMLHPALAGLNGKLA